MNREGEVCSLVTCGVHFGARRRARARRRCVPRQLRLSIRSSECCGTREEAHRHNGNANRRDGNNVRTCSLFSVGSTAHVSTAINTHERCSTREDQAHRHNGNAQWQHRGCGRPSFEHSERFASSVPLSHQQVRRARARRRTICSPERCSARVGVGEGAGARGLQSGVVAMCSSVLGACRRGRRRGGLQLNELRAAWGATGQLSGIWLGLWVSASGGAAQSASIFIMGRNPGWCLRGEQEPQRVTGSTRK